MLVGINFPNFLSPEVDMAKFGRFQVPIGAHSPITFWESPHVPTKGEPGPKRNQPRQAGRAVGLGWPTVVRKSWSSRLDHDLGYPYCRKMADFLSNFDEVLT